MSGGAMDDSQRQQLLHSNPSSPIPSTSTPPSSFPSADGIQVRSSSSASITPSPLKSSSSSSSHSPSPTNSFMTRGAASPAGGAGARFDDPAFMAGLGLGPQGQHTFPASPSLLGGGASPSGTRGSMILYRLADERSLSDSGILSPPKKLGSKRSSMVSSSGDSVYSTAIRGLVPYEYDPSQDNGPPDEEDLLHDPTRDYVPKSKRQMPWRGIFNVSLLLILVLAILCLFVFYPVWLTYRDRAFNAAVSSNARINGTGQSPVFFNMPEMVDRDTPESAKTRTGFDGQEYELVFSDEFNQDGRTFYPGDDPFWEAVDMWYAGTQDEEYYDPSQVTTQGGALVITLDADTTTTSSVTPGSTAPFTAAENHNMHYRSGMLQSWNKFCFTTGYIEVAVTFPGPDENTQGYWPGAWTMGNLGRPGYAATTDGMWPYTYDTCDVGTFPNQTLADRSGPAAALAVERNGRSRNNNELSWLPGQRVSACSCPDSDHPGPTHTRGRGAPEIDIFEAEKDKSAATGHVVSQSSQYAPFAANYEYTNTTGSWTNFDPQRTFANSFMGSATQQSISALTRLPPDMFQGYPGGPKFKTFGFEYWSDPKDPSAGYINWQANGQQSHRVAASALGPDPQTQIQQRLISVEPMSIILNLGMSENWQRIDTSTMMFPSEFRIDYVRVYQRKGHTNTGCSPPDYPTKDYINNHMDAYSNVNMTKWPGVWPRNERYYGSC